MYYQCYCCCCCCFCSLFLIQISSKAGDRCGLLVWCHLGNIIKGSTDIDRSTIFITIKQNYLLSRVQQFLLYLTLAELVGTNGKVIASLANLHRFLESTFRKIVFLEIFFLFSGTQLSATIILRQPHF